MTVTLECERCEDEFSVRDSREDTAKFCGRECQYENMSDRQTKEFPTLTCENCGVGFERKPSLEDHNDKDFCGRECVHEYRSGRVWEGARTGRDHPRWVGGYEGYYGPNWRDKRREVLERDNHRCQRCGAGQSDIGKEPSVHHKTPFREFDSYEEANKLDNLVSLCQSCHSTVEKWCVNIV